MPAPAIDAAAITIRELSLAEAVQIAAAENPNVDAVELGQTIASIRATRARLDRFTAQVQLGSDAAAGWVKPFDAPQVTDTTTGWDAHAVGAVPLYAGGAVDASIDKVDASVTIARVDTELTTRDVVRATYLAYWNVKALDLRIAATEESITVTEEALAIMQAREANELAATLDVNRSTVSLYEQQGALLAVQLDRRSAELDLVRLLHMGDAHLSLTTEPPTPVTGAVALAADAGADRPEFERLQQQAQQAASDVVIARSAALPSVVVSGRAGAGTLETGPAYDATVGVQLAWNPFDLWRVRDAVAVAKVSEQVVESRTLAQQDVIRADIRSAVARVESLRLQVPLATQQLELARDNLSIVQDLYAQGSIGILDLFSAQQSFRSARIAEVSRRVELAVAETDLLWQLGQDVGVGQ